MRGLTAAAAAAAGAAVCAVMLASLSSCCGRAVDAVEMPPALPVEDVPLLTDEAKAEAERSGTSWFTFGGELYVIEDVSGWGDYL